MMSSEQRAAAKVVRIAILDDLSAGMLPLRIAEKHGVSMALVEIVRHQKRFELLRRERAAHDSP